MTTPDETTDPEQVGTAGTAEPEPAPSAPADDDTADETGQDDAGAAPVDDLPEGAEDDSFDGGDVGGDDEDPGTAQPDAPHDATSEA